MSRPSRSRADGWPSIAVSGGSIAGLAAAVSFHRQGMDVQVFERDEGVLSSTGAGLVMQPELSNLFVETDGPALPVTRCVGRRYLSYGGSAGPLQRMPQEFTSWDGVYTSLLGRLPSELYHSGARVDKVERTPRGLVIGVAGRGTVEADVLVAADGAPSPMRRHLMPELEARYAGYVAWRGTVRERDMPRSIVEAFDDVFTFSDARSGGHALAYFIPGDDLQTARGQRRMNWVWYVGANPTERDRLLVTRDGYQRHASLRRGMARDDIIAELHAAAPLELHPMFAELVKLTPDPFLQTIVDLGVPRTVFDRTVLVGDAAFVVRPHTAGGAAKAARDGQALAGLLARAKSNVDDGLAAFEETQLDYGRELLAYGVELGRQWARV